MKILISAHFGQAEILFHSEMMCFLEIKLKRIYNNFLKILSGTQHLHFTVLFPRSRWSMPGLSWISGGGSSSSSVYESVVPDA